MLSVTKFYRIKIVILQNRKYRLFRNNLNHWSSVSLFSNASLLIKNIHLPFLTISNSKIYRLNNIGKFWCLNNSHANQPLPCRHVMHTHKTYALNELSLIDWPMYTDSAQIYFHTLIDTFRMDNTAHITFEVIGRKQLLAYTFASNWC